MGGVVYKRGPLVRQIHSSNIDSVIKYILQSIYSPEYVYVCVFLSIVRGCRRGMGTMHSIPTLLASP